MAIGWEKPRHPIHAPAATDAKPAGLVGGGQNSDRVTRL